MKDIRLTFIESIDRTETVKSFRFTPAEPINFMPGQFLTIVFDENNRRNKDLNKYLSFSCAPGKDYIEVTKRMSASNFSERLRALKKGDTILTTAPMGTCVYKDEYKTIAFLIGGIGITPVISILEYIVDKKLPTDVCLLYSNRFEHDITFHDELERWQHDHQNIHVSYTVTDCEPKDKRCRTGMIDKDMIVRCLPDVKERIVFIYGAPGMVTTMKKLCQDLAVNPANLKTESFLGY